MWLGPSLLHRRALLIAIIGPILLGSEWKCVAVSNPTLVTARIEGIDPGKPQVGDMVQFSGSGNGTPPLQFAWDFGDGAQTIGTQVAHVYLAPGDYSPTLTVRDANGNIDSDSSQIVVHERQSVSALQVVALSSPVAGQSAEFVTLPLAKDAHALNHVWTFSDGQSAIGPRTTATFAIPGTHFASVTVTDDAGHIEVARITFEVMGATQQ